MDRLEDLPDEHVIPLALGGRADAWNVLVARHERRVLLTLLARGVRVDRAKDIVQETWARLVTQQREGRLQRLDLPGLAVTQAAYLAMDDARRRSRDVPMDTASEIALLTDPTPSIEQRLTTRVELERAIAELDRCPATARRVFELIYDDPGAPHAEAARRVGLSVQRVRQCLCEVRARLRSAMERSDDESS
jgi:RNA polymerase sigma-70 factor (ECF subfamily)